MKQDIFHNSKLRKNIISWLSIKEDDKVLYLGQDEDVLAEYLKQTTRNLTCVTPESLDKLEFGNKFHYVICLGNLPCLVEEYTKECGSKGRKSDTAEVLRALVNLLEAEGKLMLALENKLGLKYFAGAKEEGTGEFFAGMESRKGSYAYGRRELSDILEMAELRNVAWYYPFPDYRFAMSIYSDEYLPKSGELIDQVGNFDEDRLTMFDESLVADNFIEEGLFQEVSNSFFLMIQREAPRNPLQKIGITTFDRERILYVKFSNDRGSKHNIRTYIVEAEDRRKYILKVADTEEAAGQIERICNAYDKLSEEYQFSRFSMNRLEKRKSGVRLEFLKGRTLEEELDLMLEAGQTQEAAERILETLSEIKKGAKEKTKSMVQKSNGENFAQVFGNINVPSGLEALSSADIDLIFSNILLTDGQKEWVVIDYEWTFDFLIPVNFVLYRAIHYYVDTTAKRKVLQEYQLYEKAGIAEEERALYAQMETAFQRYVLQDHRPLRTLYQTEGKPVYHVKRVLNEIKETERKQALVLYFDRGNGFSEEDTLAFRCEALDGIHKLEIEIPQDVKTLRVDPGNEAVTVELRRLGFADEEEAVTDFISNGHEMEKNHYMFDTKDPNLVIERLPKQQRRLQIDLTITPMELEAAQWLAPRIDTKYKWKKRLGKA